MYLRAVEHLMWMNLEDIHKSFVSKLHILHEDKSSIFKLLVSYKLDTWLKILWKVLHGSERVVNVSKVVFYYLIPSIG